MKKIYIIISIILILFIIISTICLILKNHNAKIIDNQNKDNNIDNNNISNCLGIEKREFTEEEKEKITENIKRILSRRNNLPRIDVIRFNLSRHGIMHRAWII